MTITIPELSLVVLIGVSGSGKSSFAKKHFLSTEVISSDVCRGIVSDDDNNQAATKDAFDILYFLAAKRLAAGRLTVIDATNVQPEARKPLVELARKYHCLPVAIVLDTPEKICHERNHARSDRNFGNHVIHNQKQQLQRSLRNLEREGFRHVHIFKDVLQLEDLTVSRQPLWNNKKHEHGPFDIIGDVHGCYDELLDLLKVLDYRIEGEAGILNDVKHPVIAHPQGRKAVFVGDLVDRGPKTPEVIRLVMNSVASGSALCVAGNHEAKLVRKLRGHDVKLSHGLAESVQQLEGETAEFRKLAQDFLDGLVSHYVLDDGRLVIAHAGLREEMHGRGSGQVRAFAMYGETTGEVDEFGLHVRYNWAVDYRGKAMVVYGHTPVPHADWLNNTICIDTGCVFGGNLTALRYPERELVSIPARRMYYEPIRPLQPVGVNLLSEQQQHDDVIDIEDVTGKRIIDTTLRRSITIREENVTAALEIMSRFAANPKWLIYLPPTMSPCETHSEGPWLEHPQEALAYYRGQGISEVICEEKHMGSRTVVIVCKSEEVVQKKFGITGEGIGIVYTRTGRRFFNDKATEQAFLNRLNQAMEQSGLWQELETDWLCLDAELMPWSAKAQDLLRNQYAAVGTASQHSLADVTELLNEAMSRGAQVSKLYEEFKARAGQAEKYVKAYRHYCWPVHGLFDLKLAPFHILASNGKTYFEQDHVWHMNTIAKLASADPKLIIATPFKVVKLGDEISEQEAINWWMELTASGGEGMVVKPTSFIAHGKRGLVQPAVKCRGADYLRIIYGLEYSTPRNLERLRNRRLTTKRSLALREFALGVEGLQRFVEKQPLRKVHECVFGILALESEPVDPRL
ncbi:MAG: polynucleotide kinasephosphatase [Solimicrobium sp.]|nr:polynucleotide kinasephosphatase [Solimicrobium sp.]